MPKKALKKKRREVCMTKCVSKDLFALSLEKGYLLWPSTVSMV